MSATRTAHRPAAPPSARLTPAPPETTAHDPVALWASAQVTALNVGGAPEYGGPAWCALRASDPRRSVAILTAAEQWRRHTAREAWLDHLLNHDPERWFAYVTADANDHARTITRDLARRPTHDELAARRAVHAPAREVVATPGWPPVAVPGRPGWWRHVGPRGEQLDLLHNHPQETGRCPPSTMSPHRSSTRRYAC
ncbi:hypothetical protein [Streptomyces noursei]|uniref:hypothetical protein n=1 Tax=Streptomyces noursei TaxID=1971 RepID=UPI00196234BB|nr:hypothetical protein [Streptomyces noursei]QRX90846.1 hypothetical protein JNO44_08405 [Streptomyces noursei]